jgi:hypothetical protein
MIVMDQMFWVAMTYLFTFGVLALVGYAFVRVFTAGRRHDQHQH